MNPIELIQRRIALELRPGMVVNLGIGIPTGIPQYADTSGLLFQSENGLIGTGSPAPEGMEDATLVDAGGSYVTLIPGAAAIDSLLSFSLIRGGHLDMTVLGGMQVDAQGRLANWMIPGQKVAGMGGAMDLVTGARRVVVAMRHMAKGESKIVEACSLPLTSTRRVSLVVTDLAVLEPTAEGLVLRERAPGVSVDEIVSATAARLTIPPEVPEYAI